MTQAATDVASHENRSHYMGTKRAALEHCTSEGRHTNGRVRTSIAVTGLLFGVLTLAVAPAVSAKGPKGGGGSSTGPQACAEMVETTTLAGMNAAIGADIAHAGSGKGPLAQPGVSGDDIDIAVIDTGIMPIADLETIDGPDLSFDAIHADLRFGDLHGHGTNMAGIIAGVAPDSRLIDVKVGAADGSVDVSQVIAGIDWVVQNRNANGMNIRVINLAYGTDAIVDYKADPLARAVENAWQKGIVVVVAGGNDGRGVRRLGNPALDPFVISVASTEWNISAGRWKIPSYSSTGDGTRNPDLVAPGTNVLSLNVPGSYLATTYPAAVCADGKSLRLRGTGTSQSAAAVSGAVALLLEDRPGLTPDQVKWILTNSATDIVNESGDAVKEERQGAGMVDVLAAMQTPTPSTLESQQVFPVSTGGGSINSSRGDLHVGTGGDILAGEYTAYGEPFSSSVHSARQSSDTAWTNQTWDGEDWTGGTWSGASWSGASWSGASWSGASWSGASWSGASWSGASWSGASWSGASWSGASWSGASWSGASWSGASWSGASWSGASWS